MKQFAGISACLLLSPYLLCLPSIQSAKATHTQTKLTAEASPPKHQTARITEQLTADIRNLAAEPRFTQTQYERAVAYVQAQAQALGLNAEVDWFNVRNPWKRGEADKCEILSADGASTPLRIVALANSIAGEVKRAEVVLVDYYTHDTSVPSHRFDEAGQKRLVFFSRRLKRDMSVKGYEEDVIQRNQGASWAAAYGAAGVLVRSVQTDQEKLPHAGAVSYNDKMVPAAALSVEDADHLEKLLRDGKRVFLHLAITSKHENRQQANVLIRIPGSTQPQETVLVGAHLDSHDITPGAADDAAGVASVLAVMREFARNPPSRSIWLSLFADEEINSSGATKFAEKYAADLSQPLRFVAAIEIDDGDGPPWALQVTSSAKSHNAKAALSTLRSIAARVGYEADGLELRTNSTANGADVEKLWDCYGIPEIAILQDLTKYFDKHHSRNDTPENIDIDGLEQTARLLIRIMHVITSADFVDLKNLRAVPERQCAK